MSEDKLQAAKDEAAKELTGLDYCTAEHHIYVEHARFKIDFPSVRMDDIIDRAMQLYAAQCVKDTMQEIRKALPSDEEIRNVPESEYYDDIFAAGAIWMRDRLSQLIERG